MSTTRHPSYMRRRQMRLMAQEQQREQRRQLMQASAALLEHAQQLAALFGPPLAVGTGAALSYAAAPGRATTLDNDLDNAATLVEVVDQAGAPPELWAELRKRLH